VLLPILLLRLRLPVLLTVLLLLAVVLAVVLAVALSGRCRLLLRRLVCRGDAAGDGIRTLGILRSEAGLCLVL
jgi:hypothetical protein